MDRITPAQIRGARGMLAWSMLDLARASSLSVSTIKRAELVGSQPVSGDALLLIRTALERAGVSFLFVPFVPDTASLRLLRPFTRARRRLHRGARGLRRTARLGIARSPTMDRGAGLFAGRDIVELAVIIASRLSLHVVGVRKGRRQSIHGLCTDSTRSGRLSGP